MTTAEELTIEQKNVAMLGDEELEAMGSRIREAREKKGIKQVELALQLAICKNQMYRIENGKVPCKTEYLFEIAQVLDVSLDYFSLDIRCFNVSQVKLFWDFSMF